MLHLHINAYAISGAGCEELVRLGYQQARYLDRPGMTQLRPASHFTRKLEAGREFRARFSEARALLSTWPDFRGYLEGEAVRRQFMAAATLSAALPHLSAQCEYEPWRKWRSAEIHVSHGDEPQAVGLAELLTQLGFASVCVDKGGRLSVIHSVQGGRIATQRLFNALVDHITRYGSPVSAKFSLERSAGYWTSPGFASYPDQLRRFSENE